jgi:metallophosphoesterase (TIGR00282 family)
MKLMFIGDVVGSPGRERLKAMLPGVIKREDIAFTIAQGENIAGGIGITPKTANELFDCGIDCITTGNHVWKHKEIYSHLNEEKRILRPANFPVNVPGQGYCVYTKANISIGVINLEGRVFMTPLDDPFSMGKRIAQEIVQTTGNVFIDFHAEATSEKKALGYYLCEYATGVCGTHTHVQTADEQILKGRTAYITDVGMVGSTDSILGVEKELVIEHFVNALPQRFKVEKEGIIANSVIINFDETSGIARSITRYNF